MAQKIAQKNKIQEFIAQILLYAALLVPLVVGSSYAIFPFIFPKAIYFEIVTGLLTAVFVPLVIWNRSYRVKNIYLYTLGMYVIILGLTGIFAHDPTRAFWSNHERMTGIVFIWYTILFSVLVTLFFSIYTKKLRGFLSYLVGVSVVVALTGIYQRIDYGFLMGQGGRVAGTFGNPIYLGGFSAQLALIAGYLGYINRKKPIVWWYGTAVVINVIALYLSGTRSAFAGLAVALMIIGIYGAYKVWNAGKKRLVIIATGICVGLIALLFIVPARIPALQSSLLVRLTNVSGALDSTGSTRLIAWGIAIKGFKERPLLGWGPENFYYVFNKFYNPKSLTFGTYETWFDHAHNAVFDVLVTQGILGFVAYLAQYAIIFWMCIKTRSEDENENLLSIVLLAIFVLHFVHNFFVFDHPGSYAEFYAFGGIVAARFIFWQRSQVGQPQPSIKESASPSRMPGYIVSVFAVLATIYVTVPSVRQNYLDLKAQQTAAIDLSLSQEYFKQAIAINGPHTADVLLDVGRIAQKIPLKLDNNQLFLSVPRFNDFFKFALNSLDQLITTYEPDSLLGVLIKAQLLMNVAQLGDSSAVGPAEAAFKYATALSPDRQQIAYTWAQLKLFSGDIAGAKQLLESANAKEPTIGLGHWYLAVLLIDSEPAQAAVELDLAEKNNFPIKNPTNKPITALIYFRAGQYEKAAQIFTALLDDSSTGQWDIQLIQAAEGSFVKTQRIELEAKLRARFPDAFKTKK